MRVNRRESRHPIKIHQYEMDKTRESSNMAVKRQNRAKIQFLNREHKAYDLTHYRGMKRGRRMEFRSARRLQLRCIVERYERMLTRVWCGTAIHTLFINDQIMTEIQRDAESYS